MQKTFLKAELILKYLMGDEEMDTMITCKNSEFNLVTTDQSLYEALGACENSKISIPKLIKLLEVTDVVSYSEKFKQPRTLLKEKRVTELQSKLR